jgi:hypothetical protein
MYVGLHRLKEGGNCMKNIIRYVETEMNSFAARKFNAVDSLVLSQLSYVHFEEMVPGLSRGSKPVRIGDLLKAEMFGSMFRWLNIDNNRSLLFAAAASPRFRDMLVNYYVSKTDVKLGQQFSAVTFLPGDGSAYVAFRGTDETLVGWKEDFNMAVLSPVPSQKEAAIYLDEVASLLPRSIEIRTGGHSKGGNLATYAAMKCCGAAQDRITDVFNHDGPGFREEDSRSPEFARIESRLHKTLPQSSLIGMLLHDREQYRIVESNRIGGIMQHDPFSWSVGDDDFVYTEKLTGGAVVMNRALDQWIGTLSDEKRRLFVNVLFQVLEATDAATISELSETRRKSVAAMIASIKNIDPEIKKFVSRTISDLIRLSLKNLRTSKRKPGAEALTENCAGSLGSRSMQTP